MMASEATMAPPQGSMSPQHEASWIAAEIARLSIKLQLVVQPNTDLRTSSAPLYSNVSLLKSTCMTFSLFNLYRCYFSSNDNTPFDTFVVDPSFRNMRLDGTRILHDPICNLHSDVSI